MHTNTKYTNLCAPLFHLYLIHLHLLSIYSVDFLHAFIHSFCHTTVCMKDTCKSGYEISVAQTNPDCNADIEV